MGLKELIETAYGLVNDGLIPLGFALCLLYFAWGVAKYIRVSAGSEKAAEEAKRTLVWGVVAMFVLFSVWGIISFIKSELGLPDVGNVIRKGN